MSTEVSYDTTDITWNNSPYTWDDVPAAYTWDYCIITGYMIVTDYSLDIGDSFSKVTTSNRLFTETLPINTSLTRTFNKYLEDNLDLSVSYVQNSSSIIYDVSLRSAGTTNINDIRTLARQFQVAGYEPGVEFLPGDYDFKEAIVGLVLTNNTATKIGFKEIDMYTDTPDIIDRGTVEITNSGPNYDPLSGFTTVTLNKKYHFMPNITASVVGGNDLAEPYFDPTGFIKHEDSSISFRVKLAVSSGNSSVSGTTLIIGSGSTSATTGTLAWKAVGY